ncbi:hypothetical protein HUT19_07640 [Streptomyces sp. NA02950]|uniref:hypothetical protein n=1 Tax=Streptomyces sp. NA02950 TaxID=2742137 RepID=UPI0015904811|nr:hypothetical protein [Streptomyces sp. NA02950]QKV91643.1 hypothetical protein HUT19_07640 [Streptomyces sp. NA02950]
MPRREIEPAYGYIRALDLPDDEVDALEKQLYEYAYANMLHLVDIRVERYRLLRFGDFTGWLREHQAQHVIIPSAEHVTPHPIARMMFYEAICLDAGAELHEACPEE